MQKLLIATKNPGKFQEIKEALKSVPFHLVFLGELGIDDSDFMEDGTTFAENALKKAVFFRERTGMMTLGEDSGILVSALSGELGVQTRRWGAGEAASDQEWVDYFLKRMEGIPDRAAKFVCNACLMGDDLEELFGGETSGRISESLEIPILPGIPLSSCFVPEGFDRVYAALGAEEKNKISHRGKAMKKLAEFLIKRGFGKFIF